MADGMAEAADKLRALLGAQSESVQLGAARALLELGTKLRESVELAGRVDELERLLREDDDESQRASQPAAGRGEGARARSSAQGNDSTADGPGP
jgi:hypothetical protein